MIVLIIKLEGEYKNKIKDEDEDEKFSKYLFKNKTKMQKGFMATFLTPLVLLLIVCCIEFYLIKRLFKFT